MKIDLSMLVKNLNALPHMPVPEPENIPPYVLTHILAPLKNDDCIQRRNDIPFIVADQYMAHAPHLSHLSYRMKDEDTMGKNIKI